MRIVELKDIEQKLKPHYSYEARRVLHITKFIKTEILLRLLNRIALDDDVKKAYLLLTRLHLIGKRTFSNEDFILYTASHILKELRSKKIWEEYLAAYKRIDTGLRLFCIEDDGGFYLTKSNNIPYYDRGHDYDKLLMNLPERKKVKTSFAGELVPYSFYHQKNPEIIRFPNNIKLDYQPSLKDKKGGAIKISAQNIYEAAEEMDRRLNESSRSGERANWLESVQKLTFKEVKQGKLHLSDTLKIENLCNIVGMVGSGKSTLMQVVAFWTASKGYRNVLVLDSVTEVLKTVKFFRCLGISASPLLGRYNKDQQIEKAHKNESMFLDQEYAEHLTAVCPLDGLRQNTHDDQALEYGQEPCYSLKGPEKSNTSICPYYLQCSAKADERAITSSSIIVTTPAGLIYGRAPFPIIGEKVKFVEYIIKHIDLVFFDEADRVQSNFDPEFSPSSSIDDLLASSADLVSRYLLAKGGRLDMEEEERKYIDQILSLPRICDDVKQLIRDNKAIYDWNRIGRGNSFSALILTENEEEIPKKIREQLLSSIENPKMQSELEALIASIYEGGSSVGERIEEWVAEIELLKDEWIIRIKFIIYLIALERKLRLITAYGSAVTQDETIIRSVSGFLKNHFRELQDLLPASAVGNIFGFTYDKETKILKTFRQYAFGRALMLSLPFLMMDESRKPIGPNVVLLSGTSWAKESLRYHIHSEVNYILESDPRIRQKIEETKVTQIPIDIRVSGSGENRDKNLEELVKYTAPYILSELERTDGRILFIVNSYSEASRVKEFLQRQFPGEKICYLIRDVEEDKEDTVKRGSLGGLYLTNTRMLVAPAGAIERGHNIVDERGHSLLTSVFFLTRPMNVPGDIEDVITMINGRVSGKAEELLTINPLKRIGKIRSTAIGMWSGLLGANNYSLDDLEDYEKADLAVSRLVIIHQIFGRLVRITDFDRPAPNIYFADGAFKGKNPGSFDLIQEMMSWLKKQIECGSEHEIAETLYGPFYRACIRGLKNA
ncbi:hypothetical protein AAC978_07720 [Desulfitobacterium sp. THU1]|uniref:pPIWI_RE_Z domain-containing protein n=1 Tax=Desulfitobacterium sp. THU1 TaxID=3138072 RepID=UPI00311F48D6